MTAAPAATGKSLEHHEHKRHHHQRRLRAGGSRIYRAIEAVAVVVGPVIFFLHELAWAYADAPATRVLDLPGIGPEGPDPGVAAKDSRI